MEEWRQWESTRRKGKTKKRRRRRRRRQRRRKKSSKEVFTDSTAVSSVFGCGEVLEFVQGWRRMREEPGV